MTTEFTTNKGHTMHYNVWVKLRNGEVVLVTRSLHWPKAKPMPPPKRGEPPGFEVTRKALKRFEEQELDDDHIVHVYDPASGRDKSVLFDDIVAEIGPLQVPT